MVYRYLRSKVVLGETLRWETIVTGSHLIHCLMMKDLAITGSQTKGMDGVVIFW